MFELIAALAASVFFLPVIAVLVLLVWITAERESGWAVILTLGAGFLAYHGFPSLVAFFSSPLNVALTVGGYLALGIAWSFMKWYMVINKVKTKFILLRDKYLADQGLKDGYFTTEVDESDKVNVKRHAEYANHILNAFGHNAGYSSLAHVTTAQAAIRHIRPKAANHKASILFWIGYWPFSVVWFIISDMVREAAEWIYARVAGTFQRLSDRMFADLA